MPSFDVVCEIDSHELANGLDQANREVQNRYDFKNSNAKFEHKESIITAEAESEFQVQQMLDMLYQKMAKRGIELGHFKAEEPQQTGKRCVLKINIQQGIDKDLARKIVKMVKDAKMKVQAAIQGEQVRVSGKKRDDLQQVIALLKSSNIELPLQFSNFRD